MAPLHISRRERVPSTYLNSILFVLFGQTDRGKRLESHESDPEEAFLLKFLRALSIKIQQEDKRFSRKAPFISSFVFNPRILLDDNLPPPCPIRWRHEKSATDSSSDRFHFSSLTCLHLLVTYYYRSAREMKLGKMTNYFKFRQKKLSQLLIKLILLFSNGSKNI